MSPSTCIHARIRGRAVVSLALAHLMVCAPAAALLAQVQFPGANIPVTVIDAKGVISGTVASSSGRRLRGITMQLVNPSGSIVGTVVTASDGEFRFPETDFGLYTLQCVRRRQVVGTSSVTLAAPIEAVKMICAADPGYWQTWGLVTVLGAAATTAGVAAIVAPGDAGPVVGTRSVASPSR